MVIYIRARLNINLHWLKRCKYAFGICALGIKERSVGSQLKPLDCYIALLLCCGLQWYKCLIESLRSYLYLHRNILTFHTALMAYFITSLQLYQIYTMGDNAPPRKNITLTWPNLAHSTQIYPMPMFLCRLHPLGHSLYPTHTLSYWSNNQLILCGMKFVVVFTFEKWAWYW